MFLLKQTSRVWLSRGGPFRCLSQSRLAFGGGDKPKDNRPIQPKELSSSELSQAVEDAASFDETTGVDQVQWRSSAYHRDESSYFSRPPQKLNVKTPSKTPPSTSDDSQNSVILFPGQGSQFIGMGKSLVENVPSVKEMFDSASHILGYDLLKICLEGPQEMLNQTKYCQPAILVTSLAAVEALFASSPHLVKNCIATAGFSVGEITALIFSGAFSFEDGIRLIAARAEAMEFASSLADSGMITIFYGKDANLGMAMKAAQQWVEERHGIEKPVCQIANYLYEGAKAIGGHKECLKFIEENKSDFRIRRVKWLPVSGAFHTPLMKPAVEPFQMALSMVQVAEPRIPVYSNFDQVVITDTSNIVKNLPRQIVNCVKWEQSMIKLFRYEREEYLPQVFECGPGSSLTAMLQKLNGKVGKRAMAVEV